jgi:hypothetical protein
MGRLLGFAAGDVVDRLGFTFCASDSDLFKFGSISFHLRSDATDATIPAFFW